MNENFTGNKEIWRLKNIYHFNFFPIMKIMEKIGAKKKVVKFFKNKRAKKMKIFIETIFLKKVEEI